MPNSLKVLHITGHLGGGVGRVLSKLAAYNRHHATGIEDSFICLETPRDTRYADAITASGAPLWLAPDEAQMRQACEAADIVQLEWWHHPLMAKWLGFLSNIPARWVIWSHTSGLHYPIIPPAFARLPHAFLTTTPMTLPLLDKDTGGAIIANVSGTGGFDDFPLPDAPKNGPAHCGYLGSFSPAKMHPDIVEYIEAVGRPDFHVDFYGDSSVNPDLEKKVRGKGEQSPIRLRGFCTHPQEILPNFDLFIYLLNSTHFGTTENALLEAMACGAVPIVLNNPVESGIVQHGVTGFIVDSPESFATAVRFLLDHPQERQRMSLACAQAVREQFSVARSATELAEIYRPLMKHGKKTVDFTSLFGKTPADIFLSCLGDYAACFTEKDSPAQRARRLALLFLYEKSKSSAAHFHAVFPDDARLAVWKAMLYSDINSSENPR